MTAASTGKNLGLCCSLQRAPSKGDMMSSSACDMMSSSAKGPFGRRLDVRAHCSRTASCTRGAIAPYLPALSATPASRRKERKAHTHTHTHTHTSTCFPVLLVRVERGAGMSKAHTRGRKDHAAGVLSGVSGWDLVVPRQWALPVWHALIKCGCRALALRESQVFNSCRRPALDTS